MFNGRILLGCVLSDVAPTEGSEREAVVSYEASSNAFPSGCVVRYSSTHDMAGELYAAANFMRLLEADRSAFAATGKLSDRLKGMLGTQAEALTRKHD